MKSGSWGIGELRIWGVEDLVWRDAISFANNRQIKKNRQIFPYQKRSYRKMIRFATLTIEDKPINY